MNQMLYEAGLMKSKTVHDIQYIAGVTEAGFENRMQRERASERQGKRGALCKREREDNMKIGACVYVCV